MRSCPSDQLLLDSENKEDTSPSAQKAEKSSEHDPSVLPKIFLWKKLWSLFGRNGSRPLFIACIARGDTMERCRSKKKSNKLLKTVILFSISAVIWLLFQ